MPYNDDDRSVQDSAPVELVQFVYPIATTRYAGGYEDVTVDVGAGPVLFTAAPVQLGPIQVVGVTETREFTVTLPIMDAVVQTYKTGGPPPRELKITAWRYQFSSGTFVQIGKGFASDLVLNPQKGEGSFRIASLTDEALNVEIPSIKLSRTCQAFLYDTRCGVNKATFTTTTTITAISTDGKTVSVAAHGGGSDSQYYVNGLLEHLTSTEQRAIVSQSGLDFTLNLPLRSATIGQSVNISAGCSRLVNVCAGKFANVENFRGHPNIQASNPFIVGLRKLLRKI
jgi:hypothetical protein